MVGGYQLIDLKDCLFVNDEYILKKAINTKKSIKLLANGLHNINCFDSWNYVGHVPDEDGKYLNVYTGTFYDNEDEITIYVSIYDEPTVDGEYTVNTKISFAGGE